ncbi:MAG: type III secretion system chaperone [Endozoicomonadaceae bacterium]|nr:type III secretion system chaperone [Endozoicomonadaceae bacterium]
MSHRQNVEENLQRFAEGIGLGELKLNEHGACGLCFDDTMIVNIEYLEDDEAMVFVSSVKRPDPHDTDKAQLFEKLLFINLQHHSMQSAFLALNHDKTEILLIKSMPGSLDYGSFEANLEKFVNTLEWCIAEVDNQSDTPIDLSGKTSSGGELPSPPSGQPGDDMGIMV